MRMTFNDEQFTQILIRISHMKFKTDEIITAFSKLLYQDLIGFCKTADISGFRINIRNISCQEIINKYNNELLILYSKSCESNDFDKLPMLKKMNESEWINLLKIYNLYNLISEIYAKRIFYECQGGKVYIGPVAEVLNNNEINYSEFIEGIIVLSCYIIRDPFIELPIKIEMFFNNYLNLI